MSAPLPRIDYYRAADGRRLAVRVWDVARPPRARVVFLHGITSHGGWYNRSCRHLAEAGLEVHFLDRRGSGLNVDRPGDVDRYQTWLDDVEVYLDAIAKQGAGGREQGAGAEDSPRLCRGIAEEQRAGSEQRATDISPPPSARHGESPVATLPLPPSTFRPPVVLCGISWGGKLAVAVARHRPHLVSGLVLLCPGLYSPHEPGPLARLLLTAPKPARLWRRRVNIPLDRPALFTDSPRWRDYIAHDPLSLRKVTVRFARADRRLTRLARQSATFLHLPLLLMLGGRDRIVDNRRTRAFFSRAPAAHKTLIEYPNAAHTLEFEPDPRLYFHDLTDWIGKTTTA